MKWKKILLYSAAVITGLAIYTGIHFYWINRSEPICSPSPVGCMDDLKQADQPSYKTASAYFILDTGDFECSKPIQLVSTSLDSKGEYVNYEPVDPAEGNVLCHITTAIEFKGKLTVLRRPEVIQLVEKYHYRGVSIKAVKFKYIQDKEYVHRLLPAYVDREIGCIIVLVTPSEKKVYLEDEKLNTFEEIDYSVFEKSLNSISAADRQTFLDNLK